jgi:hypothetical protein
VATLSSHARAISHLLTRLLSRLVEEIRTKQGPFDHSAEALDSFGDHLQSLTVANRPRAYASFLKTMQDLAPR